MSIIKGFKRQLRSVIEWENPMPDSLFYKWADNGDEIKNASKLIVGPGQGCIFVYQGRVMGVYEREMVVDLKTANIPFWTTVTKAMQSFKSEHKVGLYFFKKTKILNQKWGTKDIIKYEDPVYSFPVGLRAFGNYSFKIKRPAEFFRSIVGSVDNYYISDLREVINDRIITPLSDYLAEERHTYTKIDSFRDEISMGLQQKLEPHFEELGFEISDFRVEGLSFDDKTVERIDRIADMTAEAHAAKAVGMDYKTAQSIEAMRDAGRNEGGVASMGLGMGVGASVGNMFSENMKESSLKDDCSITSKLKKLKDLFDSELINEEEYSQKKSELLRDL